jgi:hypothetical protein
VIRRRWRKDAREGLTNPDGCERSLWGSRNGPSATDAGPGGDSRRGQARGMRAVVDLEEADRIDGGVALRRGQRGMAQSSWIARRSPPAARRWVAKEWRSAWGRGGGGQAEAETRPFHGALDDAGVERAAAGAAEEGRVPGDGMRAKAGIGRDRRPLRREGRGPAVPCRPCQVIRSVAGRGTWAP